MAKWTDGEETTNSSQLFREAVWEVEKLICQSAWSLINGKARDVAGLIVAQIAHQNSPFSPWPEVRKAIAKEENT